VSSPRSAIMMLFALLLTATVVAAEPEKKFVLDSLGNEAAKILVCTSKLTKEKCDSCCDTTNWGTDIVAITNTEKGACHTACKILPMEADYITTTIIPGGPFKREQEDKRFVLENLSSILNGVVGDSAIVAMCAAKLNEQDCQYCCQTSQFQVSDAAEKALCTTGCQILPSKTGVEKRFLFEDLTGDNLKKDAAIIAECELKPTTAECEACCNEADWGLGLIALAEKPACVAGCKALHNNKRFLLDNVGDIAADAAIIAQCELKTSKAECEACCNAADFGFLASVETPACVAGCSLTHQNSKRFIVDSVGDIAKDAAIIAQCQLKSKAECEACCNAADFGFLASVETPGCVAGCSLTHQNTKRGILDTLQQETAKVMTCDAMGVEEKCHTCCETTNWGISALAATEKNLCVNSCYMLPAQSSVDKMPATAAPADNSGSGF